MLLGDSEKKVIDWLKENKQGTSKEIGDACYKFSWYGRNKSEGYYGPYVRTGWAGKVLNRLEKRGVVIRSIQVNNNPVHWKLRE